MHLPQLCRLNGVVGVKGVGDPMITVVVSTMCYLHFVSYASTLALGMDPDTNSDLIFQPFFFDFS
jgi:hypothetical protein